MDPTRRRRDQLHSSPGALGRLHPAQHLPQAPVLELSLPRSAASPRSQDRRRAPRSMKRLAFSRRMTPKLTPERKVGREGVIDDGVEDHGQTSDEMVPCITRASPFAPERTFPSSDLAQLSQTLGAKPVVKAPYGIRTPAGASKDHGMRENCDRAGTSGTAPEPRSRLTATSRSIEPRMKCAAAAAR